MTSNLAPDYVPPGYRIERLLGSGQTSHVYLAHHEEHGALALKLPYPGLPSRTMLRRMFENEVQLTLRLSHENVIAAYEGFPTGERAFLALEYCANGTLDRLLYENKGLPLALAFGLIADIGQGLEHAHSRNVLHRDVKPANVFLSAAMQGKLGDFGTGTHTTDPPQERVGTAFYMAPEVFRGEPATVESDIYSLGILAYEVIAGQRPFQGGSYEVLMLEHLSGLPKNLLHYRPELDKRVVSVIARAMARDGSKRYSSVADFNAAFAQATGYEVPPLPIPDIVTGRSGRHSQGDKQKAPRGFLGRFGRKKQRE